VRSPWRRLGLGLLIAAAACAPFLATDYQLFRLTSVLIYAIALLGVNVLVGYNGQISLGHGAFYALGAYAAAIQIAHFGVPHWAAVPLAGAICLVAGFAFGLPTLRLGAMHFAMATFALGFVLPGLARHKSVERWTGGTQGMELDRPQVPFGLALSFDQWMYLFTLLALVLSVTLAANLLQGRIGRAIVALRDDPIAAEASGIHAGLYKPAALGVSAMFTGVAGALAATALQYVAPGLFGIFLSFGFLIGAMVGGIATLAGALYGALFLQVIFAAVGATARSLQTAQVFVLYGIALTLVALFLPGGVAGLVTRLMERARRGP
jgi:branched-chain amino acid transport system permease protein